MSYIYSFDEFLRELITKNIRLVRWAGDIPTQENSFVSTTLTAYDVRTDDIVELSLTVLSREEYDNMNSAMTMIGTQVLVGKWDRVEIDDQRNRYYALREASYPTNLTELTYGTIAPEEQVIEEASNDADVWEDI